MRLARRIYHRARTDGLSGLAARAVSRLNKLDLVQFGLRRLLLPSKVRHLHGPASIDYAADELVAISVVRNGMLWIGSFLRHHRALGVRHFVILDNGSTDGTTELLAREPDVTLLATDAPYHAYENTMKRYLAERFCGDRWCLCVDVDELFDFPGSGRLSLADFLTYLESSRYNAVITQMLDMFSETPLRDLSSSPEDDLIALYPFYDTSKVFKKPYPFLRDGDRIRMHRGGIRFEIFGTLNGLTKVSLFKMDGKLKPFAYWHHARNARIADVSAVLLHFPFVESFYAKVAEAVASGRYGYLTSDEYAAYLNGLERSPALQLKLESAKRLHDVDQLVDEGFLIVSPAYERFAAGRAASARDAMPSI